MENLINGLNIGIWQMMLLLILLCALVFPILALISIFKNKFEGNGKLIWVLVVLLLPFIGSILYFLIGRPKAKREIAKN